MVKCMCDKEAQICGLNIVKLFVYYNLTKNLKNEIS
jgi:hypothetical protein